MELNLQLGLPTDASGIPVVRRLLHVSLDALGVDRDCVDDLDIALTEPCTNVLVHAGGTEDYFVSAVVTDETCVIEVSDHGVGFDSHAVSRTSSDEGMEHGRGLPLMKALVDQLEFSPCPGGGTIARLTKGLSWASEGTR